MSEIASAARLSQYKKIVSLSQLSRINLHIATICLGAFLLFLIQPMISKIMLPYLGGVPAVWSVSMMMFQLLLLGGYLYAHLSVKYLSKKQYSLVHGFLLVLALWWLPFKVELLDVASAPLHPINWLMAVLAENIGLIFFLLAATSPLIQVYFANNFKGNSPYYLFAASNAGSLMALISYPFIWEYIFTTQENLNLWCYLFLVYVAGFLLIIMTSSNKVAKKSAKVKVVHVPNGIKLKWLTLSFFPSSLVLGLTTFITTDIGSVPLLWILPLSIYLSTFIAAFSGRGTILIENCKQSILPYLLLVVLIKVLGIESSSVAMIMHLMLFVAISLTCHHLLYKLAPPKENLTEFYLIIAFGGLLGGVFNSLIAPLVFQTTVEYMASLFGAVLLIGIYSKSLSKIHYHKFWHLLPAIVFFCISTYYVQEIDAFVSQYVKGSALEFINANSFMGLFVAIILCYMAYLLRNNFVYCGVFLCGIYLAMNYLSVSSHNLIIRERNFFGVISIYSDKMATFRSMQYNTTGHGIQYLNEDRKLDLNTYYTHLRNEVYNHLSDELRNKPIAMMGLGIGAVTCLATKGQDFDVFEINPLVLDIATQYFTYLKDCPGKINVSIGDGRLLIANQESNKYSMIVIDAFSSDSIPVHLLTKEAIDIYMDKIKEKGVVAFHVSNRHLKLSNIIFAYAKFNGLYSIDIKYDRKTDNAFNSEWIMLTKDEDLIGRLRKDTEGKVEIGAYRDVKMWTDDYSNLLSVLW